MVARTSAASGSSRSTFVSFETDIDVVGLAAPFHAVFIRAPKVEAAGTDVEVLATHDGVPVLARQGHVMVASFHPEITPDARLHEMFLQHNGFITESHSVSTERG
jgi:pyridoxal 5'-phosphate synthase pdxT subunit